MADERSNDSENRGEEGVKQPIFVNPAPFRALPEFASSCAVDELAKAARENFSCWIVDSHNEQEAVQVLHAIRQHLAPSVYLRPVLLLTDNGSAERYREFGADEWSTHERFNLHTWADIAGRLEPINQWIETLSDCHSPADTNIAFRVLRMITARSREFSPLLADIKMTGYLYPELESLFVKGGVDLLQTLDFLESQSLLKGRFFSRAHFCSHCGSAFLNFKETCPQCQSNDLRVEELIHHYRCAYVGESVEFHKGGHLSCPKCERPLKHIGVDYDKPSVVHQCNECGHSTQHPEIVTTCYSCARTMEPENQLVRTVKSYEVSAIGRNAALFGLENLFTSILENDLKLFSDNSFRDFFEVEKARVARYKKSVSSLATIQFKALDQLYIKLGERAKDVFGELSTVFRAVFRRSDVITARNESLFLVIMTETNRDSAEIAVLRLSRGVEELLLHNLNYAPELGVSVNEIDSELELDAVLEQLLTAPP